jgi:hypothetical protein
MGMKGWSMKDVDRANERISGQKLNEDASYSTLDKKTLKAAKKKEHPDYPGMISNALNCIGIEHVREYKFLGDRRFRFDLAIGDKKTVSQIKTAIEFEGGIYLKKGGHTTGKGYTKDVKKYNLAVRYGWRLIRFTTSDVSRQNWEFAAADQIRELITVMEDKKC